MGEEGHNAEALLGLHPPESLCVCCGTSDAGGSVRVRGLSLRDNFFQMMWKSGIGNAVPLTVTRCGVPSRSRDAGDFRDRA